MQDQMHSKINIGVQFYKGGGIFIYFIIPDITLLKIQNISSVKKQNINCEVNKRKPTLSTKST